MTDTPTGQPSAEHPAGGSPPPAATPPTPPAPPAVAPPAAGTEFKAPWGDEPWLIDGKPWYAGIQEEPVRALMEAKAYKNPNELAMAYHNANKLVAGSADAVVVPKSDAPPEEWDKFFQKTGRPDAPEGYDLKFDETAVAVDPAMVDFGKKFFHKLGLDPKRAQAGADMWNEFVLQSRTQQGEALRVQNEGEIADLTQRWGPQMNEHLAQGKAFMEASGLPAALVDRVESAIGTAAVVELLAHLGSKMKEGGFVGSSGGAGGGEKPQQTIERMRSDPEIVKGLSDALHPRHKEYVDALQLAYSKL